MKKIGAILFLGLCLASSAMAANICVGPAASGNGTGSDWNNVAAWGTLSFSRANTYYLKEGTTYSGKTLNTASNGNVIAIKKATPQDHGIALNWDDLMGDGQTQFNGQIRFDSSDWVFDGQTGGGPGKWSSGFGFKIIESGNGNALLIVGQNTTANNITIRHVDLQGKGSVSTSGGSASNDGLAIYGDSDVTLSYAWMHGIGRCPFFFAGNIRTVMEYIYVEKFYGSGPVHSEVMSSGQGLTGDTTFRYNLVTDIQSTGGLMWDNNSDTSSHLYVYGNVFYKPAGAVWEGSNGVIGGWTGSHGEEFHNCYVFNNTFINIDQATLSAFPDIYGGNMAKNNLFYNCQAPGFSIFATHNHNHFINSGTAPSESGTSSTATGDPFNTNGLASLNFSLKANTPPGENLSALPGYISDMGKDPTGKIRSTWTRGAYEFGSGAPAQNPHPADANLDFLMVLNEATKYGACWKNPAAFGDCPSGIAIDYAVRAGTLWAGSANGQYQYNSVNTCPLCWEIKP